MIGCSLGKVILFINYLPYLATLFPFSLSSSFFFLIFFKTTVSEFRAGKVISRPPQRQEESWYYSGSLQPNLRGFFHHSFEAHSFVGRWQKVVAGRSL